MSHSIQVSSKDFKHHELDFPQITFLWKMLKIAVCSFWRHLVVNKDGTIIIFIVNHDKNTKM